MTLENDELLIEQLKDFDKLSVKAISPALEEYLKLISKTGDTCCNWTAVKPLLVYKLNQVLDIFYETVVENSDVHVPTQEEFQGTKERLTVLLQGFYRAPFTIQRLMELLLEPNLYYKRFDKFARGLEKVLSVVTTVDPYPNKAPSSLLPNTVLNGNGDMRVLDDCKKTTRDEGDDEAEERSPKRMKLMKGEGDERENSKENTEPNNDDKVEPITSLFAPAQSTTNENAVSTTCDGEQAPVSSFPQPDKPKAEPEVEAVSPDSTTSDISQKIPEVSGCSEAQSMMLETSASSSEENEVSTTQQDQQIPKTSLSDILSDSLVQESPNNGT